VKTKHRPGKYRVRRIRISRVFGEHALADVEIDMMKIINRRRAQIRVCLKKQKMFHCGIYDITCYRHSRHTVLRDVIASYFHFWCVLILNRFQKSLKSLRPYDGQNRQQLYNIDPVLRIMMHNTANCSFSDRTK